MVHILHSAKDRESVLNSGVIHGSTRNSRKKGLTNAYPLIVTTVVDDVEDACCPHFGEPMVLTVSMLERVCEDEWYLCRPSKGAVRAQGCDDVHTLYLIPSNEQDVAQARSCSHTSWKEYYCITMGMEDLLGCYMPDDIHDALQDEYNCLPYGDHLHVTIIADEIQLRPPPGQPGSCRCGNIASPACDYDLCNSCCGGCNRHGDAEPAQPARPPAGQPGSCRCGNIASPACDYDLCNSCCSGCSRHGDTEPAQPARPPAGQPGSCRCGNTASPACDYDLCNSCCGGCSRHGNAEPAQPIIMLGGGVRVLPQSSSPPAAAVPAARSSTSSSSSSRTVVAAGGGASSSAAAAAAATGGPSSSAAAGSSHQTGEGSGALQRLRERLLETMTTYLSTTSVQQHHPEDLQPLMDIMHVVLDGPLWGPAAAEAEAVRPASGGSSSGAQPSRSRNGGSAGTAGAHGARVAGGLSLEGQLHQATHCVVCLDAIRDTLLLPCKHLVLCQSCSSQLQQLALREALPGSSNSSRPRALCPVCRVPVAEHVSGVILA